MKKHPFKEMSGIIMTGILSFAMIFTVTYLIPVTVKGAPAEEYGLWIAGTQVTSDNADNVLSGDDANNGKVSYNPDTNTLTLNGANIEYQADATAAEAVEHYAVYAKDMDFTIVLQGENTVTVTSEAEATGLDTEITSAVYCENGNLSINGPGSLEAVNKTDARMLYAILSDNALTLTECKVTAEVNGNQVNNNQLSFDVEAAALYAKGKIYISGSELTAKCSTEVHSNANSAGIYTENDMEIVNQSDVKVVSREVGIFCKSEGEDNGIDFHDLVIDDSKLTVQGENADIFTGITVGGTMSVKNGANVLVNGTSVQRGPLCVRCLWLDIDNAILTANAGNAVGGSLAIDVGPDKMTGYPDYEKFGFGIQVANNGTLVANGGMAEYVGRDEGVSIGIQSMDIEVRDGGRIIAKASDATGEDSRSFAIYCLANIKLGDGGTIMAQSGAADMSWGICVMEKIEQSGGVVTSQAGTGKQALAILLASGDSDSYDLGEGIYTVKAGNSEADAQTIDKITDNVWMNPYVHVEYSCSHEWSETWSSDETHHWHDCKKQYCTVTENKDKDGYAAHTPNQDDGDCTTPVPCSACREVITPAQEHAFGTVYFHDADSHWQQCVHDGCTQKSEKQNHTFIEGTPNPAPTYEAEGRRVDTCICGETKTVVLPKLVNGSAPQLSVADGGMYCTATIVTVTDDNLDTVTLNGEPVTLINGQFTVLPSDKVQTITAVNKTGEKTTVSITVNAEHTWDEGKIVISPTETTEGVKVYTCGDCGQTKAEAVAKLESEDDEEDEEDDGQNEQALNSPSTKDTSNTAGWLAILLISGSGLAGMYISGRKKAF